MPVQRILTLVLLGTVVGIIRAFGTLGSGSPGLSRDILLASGVSEALVATAAGLVLAVISATLYALFRNRAQSLISEMESATTHIIGLAFGLVGLGFWMTAVMLGWVREAMLELAGKVGELEERVEGRP